MNKYFFDHIPKTGGQALYSIFRDVLGGDNISPLLMDKFSNAILNYHHFDLIQGHFEFFPKDKEKFNNFFSATLLRDPIDRTLSHYFFYKKDALLAPGKQFQSLQLAKNLDLLNFLEDATPSVVEITHNYQTRHFLQLEWDGSTELTDSEKLNLAKKALHHYDLVGVYQKLIDFLDIFCYECGWLPVKKIPRVNVTSKRPKPSEVDPKIIRRLEELNQLDLALYDYATQLFNEKKRQILHECIERRHREIYNSLPQLSSQGVALPLISLPEEEKKSAIEAPLPADFGNRQLEIINVKVKGEVSLTNTLFSGEKITIRVVFRAHIDVENLTIGIHIHDRFGRLAFGTNSECLGHALHVRTGGIYFVDYRFRNDLGIGAYTIGAALHIGSNHLSGCFHWRDEVTRFEVVGNIGYHFEGVAKLYPQLRCGVLGGNPADIKILPTAQDWPQLQQIAIYTPKLTEFRAQICLLQALEQLRPNEVIATEAEITNTSHQTWSSTGQCPVNLSYHWRTPSGEWLEFDGLRTPLPHDIAPGETFSHYLTIKSPSQSGDALLQLTLVQEGVAWFDKQGYPPLEIRVRIGE